MYRNFLYNKKMAASTDAAINYAQNKDNDCQKDINIFGCYREKLSDRFRGAGVQFSMNLLFIQNPVNHKGAEKSAERNDVNRNHIHPASEVFFILNKEPDDKDNGSGNENRKAFFGCGRFSEALQHRLQTCSSAK